MLNDLLQKCFWSIVVLFYRYLTPIRVIQKHMNINVIEKLSFLKKFEKFDLQSQR